MTKPYYEVHITMEDGHGAALRDRIKYLLSSYNWKYSRIDGDPILGDGVKQYATRHYHRRTQMEYVRMQLDLMHLDLERIGAIVVRKKIEAVLVDEKVKPYAKRK